ncbi:hypothetical protein H257_18910 [Aphanomyces astaci]|uniref:Uncharacterized protein n=1 Tax=Aphanomyces astaci TaxID=112090 RepID=W4FBH4_APHAT|nr:hypothetical protein H257_18910 [Aphanomyces astaci]ETV64156.1 hypothetical protein H257_18910 [Aphanomyces astaci]|eukprot:XP_009846360.1 hypothetical protein H257_18910 [Aphanomyces astaci]
MSHLTLCHPVYKGSRTNVIDGCAFQSYVSPAAVLLHGWMDLTVTKHMPLSTVEDHTIRKYIQPRPNVDTV